MKRLTNRRRAIRDEIAVKYLPRVQKTVAYFVKRNPRARYLRNDMEAEATYWVLHAATRHVSGHPIKKMDGYMHLCIMTGVSLAIRDDKGIQKPRANPAKKVGGTEKMTRRLMGDTLYSAPTPLLDACCEDDTDVDILKLIYRGLGNNAISRELGITVKNIKDRKVAIHKRLEFIEAGKDDVAGSEDGA